MRTLFKKFTSLIIATAMVVSIFAVPAAPVSADSEDYFKQVDAVADSAIYLNKAMGTVPPIAEADTYTDETWEYVFGRLGIVSLLSGKEFDENTPVPPNYAFCYLWHGAGLLEQYATYDGYVFTGYKLPFDTYIELVDGLFACYDEVAIKENMISAGWYDPATDALDIMPGGFGGPVYFELLNMEKSSDGYKLQGLYCSGNESDGYVTSDMEEFCDYFFNGTEKLKIDRSLQFTIKKVDDSYRIASCKVLPYYDYNGARYCYSEADGRFYPEEETDKPESTVCEHKWDAGIISQRATTEKAGVRKYTCKKCAAVRTAEIAKIRSTTASSLIYNGKSRTKNVIVTDVNGKKLVKGTDFTVAYKNSNGTKFVTPKTIGTYKAVVKFKGAYSGTVTKTFKINPQGTKILKITKPASKQIKVTWKKQAVQTTGYQIRYSTNAKMSDAKSVWVTKSGTTARTIKQLKAKMKYWVQIRTYKTVNGVKHCSAWSGKMAVVVR